MFLIYCKEIKYLFNSFKFCYIMLKNTRNCMYYFFLKARHSQILKSVLKMSTYSDISKTHVFFFSLPFWVHKLYKMKAAQI